MSEYRTAWCPECGQASYLPERAFRAPAWRCPACGAVSSSAHVREPDHHGVAVLPSRFGRMITERSERVRNGSIGSRARRGVFRRRG